MPIDVDLTECCKECYMPLHGGICEFDPEHTPLPQDLDDPEIAGWFLTWLAIYQRRNIWPFAVIGPLAAVPELDAVHGLAGMRASETLDLPANEAAARKGVGATIAAPAQSVRASTLPGSALLSPAAVARMPASIGEWLLTIDQLGFVVCYHDAIVAHFDSPAQVVDVYARRVPPGEGGGSAPSAILLDERFFEDVGIQKLGHRRLFEKWFASILAESAVDAASYSPPAALLSVAKSSLTGACQEVGQAAGSTYNAAHAVKKKKKKKKKKNQRRTCPL
eukprot:NODE_14084_length_1129_cov_12.336327.p1 GENE.NODE_14084_length_1129_cov_12.336327~~NODE_14084_length_1129_cov_12.336327.p1  ORF type:complete len:278 (+),score=75.49 NODE_14084_length_1129_cov_12.336327:190-1023(+)